MKAVKSAAGLIPEVGFCTGGASFKARTRIVPKSRGNLPAKRPGRERNAQNQGSGSDREPCPGGAFKFAPESNRQRGSRRVAGSEQKNRQRVPVQASEGRMKSQKQCRYALTYNILHTNIKKF